MPKGKKMKTDDDGDDDWRHDDDDTPNMSQGAGSSSTQDVSVSGATAPKFMEGIANDMIQEWWKEAYTCKCPFNSSMINRFLNSKALTAPRLCEDIRYGLPLRWDPREGSSHVIGGDCCCKGDKYFTAAELQAHGKDTARNGGSMGAVHKTLSQFLIGQGYGASSMEPAATIRSQIEPMAAIDEVSWPPLVVLRSSPGYEKLIMSKGQASKYLGAVAKATEYVPVYTAPAHGSGEASQFLGQIVLIFKGGSEAEQDSMLDAAVALREEVIAQYKPDDGSIFASADLLDRAHYHRLPASCKRELEKSNGGRPFEWRKLHEERSRARNEAVKRAAVRTCACTCTCAHLLRRLKRIERSPRIKPLTDACFVLLARMQELVAVQAQRDEARAGMKEAQERRLQMEEEFRNKERALQEAHASVVHDITKATETEWSNHFLTTLRLQQENQRAEGERRLALEQMRAKEYEKALLEAHYQDELERQQRKLDEALGEAEALRVDREQLVGEELRAAKQVIVDALNAENEDKNAKIQLQLVRTQKELEEAKAKCQDAVENYEDFAKPLQLQNDLLMAKIDALGMAVLLSTAPSLKPDEAENFGRGMLTVDLKQKDSKQQIAGKAREFLWKLEKRDVLQAGYNFTLKLAASEKKDAIIQKIMESKFE